MLGRGFEAHEDRAGCHVAVISHVYWQRVFGGDPRVLGTLILIADTPHTIIGVMPQGFLEPRFRTANIWTSFAFPLEGNAPRGQARGWGIAGVIGRLKPGVTRQQAGAELSAIQAGLAQTYSKTGFEPQLRCTHPHGSYR